MFSYKNARFHDQIRKWNTRQLIEVLESNGLADCCDAVKNREIDGDTFLNLTEGQLAFWRLSTIQTKRLWSYIQLAKEKPQNFITNLPESKPTSTETLNTRKVDKIKSPITDSLNNLFGQQNNPTPTVSPQPLEIPEGNYPKVMPPLNPNNDFQQRVPPRPGALPPKPPNFQNKRIPIPPAPIVNSPQDINPRPSVNSYPRPPGPPSFSPQHQQHEEEYEEEPTSQYQNEFQSPVNPVRPINFQNKRIPQQPSPVVNIPPNRHPISSYPKPPSLPPSFTHYQEHEGEDFYEEEPMAEPQNDFQPQANPVRPSNFQNKRIPVLPTSAVNSPQDITSRPPVTVPQSSSSYPKPPGPPFSIPQLPQHINEDVYEEEPMVQHQNDFKPPVTVNQSSLYSVPPSNPIPIRRVAPLPTSAARPLPTPPKDETPFPLPPNVVPITRNARSPLPPEVPDFPRPPTNIPNFHDHDDADDEQPEYDDVEELQIPEYRRQSWFQDIERGEARRILRDRPNGTFIARPSRQPGYECTFSVIYDSKIYNLPVIKDNGKVVLGKNSFNSVMEIVEKFFENPLVLNGPNNEDLYVTLKKF